MAQRASAPSFEKEAADAGSGRRLLLLSLAAVGIAFGDIGTSPLYALRESFHGHGVSPTRENVLGVLSLITWSLLLVVSLKYMLFVLRADNQGEGGILALTSLVTRVNARRGGSKRALVALGLLGGALLYGDGMITPAISVLSAVEGLGVAAPVMEPYVLPLTLLILLLLFGIQRQGTTRVGSAFGPVMLLWFAVLAVLGLRQIILQPGVLAAVDPRHSVSFLAASGRDGFLVVGSVFLVVTGSEALYADIGHFGKRAVRFPWFALVLPALLLNYWGQGALVYAQPHAVSNPFFLLAPEWARLPLVLLATVAAAIASQALISGVFSLTRQAVQLGYSPRMTIRHTSAQVIGQVYVPAVNWALLLACCALVLGFRTSGGLAAAYGIAVSTSMVFTGILLAAVMRERWRWSLSLVVPLAGALLLVDLVFFGSNLLRVAEGGWFPLLIGALVFTLMTTWQRGRQLVRQHLAPSRISFETLRRRLAAEPPVRVPGTAVYMSASPFTVPTALLHNPWHNKVLHERVLFLAVETADTPRVPPRLRVESTHLGAGVHQVIMFYGFIESPDVHRDLRLVRLAGEAIDPAQVS